MTTSVPAPVELLIGGMTCGACARRIERTLNKIDGVTALVNYATATATIDTSDRVTTDDLIAAVTKAGYSAEPPAPAAPPAETDTVPDPALV